MAQKIEVTSGSVLCGSPIIVSVTAESPGSDVTFHRLKLLVKVALSSSGEYEEYLMSWPASNGEIVDFDISSALRSKLKEYTYEALESNATMPFLKYTMQAWDEWMLYGILVEEQGKRDYGGYLYALAGSFTEVERSLSGSTKNLTVYSRKPKTGEICNLNDIYLSSAPPSEPISLITALSSGPTVTKTLLDAVGARTIDGRTVTVEDNPNRWLFQFVNGLGVIETASCMSLESLKYEFANERNVLNSFRKFKPSATRSMTRISSSQVYELTSGYVTPEWADWWCNEFLNSPASWVRISDKWFPCTVEPDEETQVYDRSEGSLIQISFTMRPDFSGGFHNLV